MRTAAHLLAWRLDCLRNEEISEVTPQLIDWHRRLPTYTIYSWWKLFKMAIYSRSPNKIMQLARGLLFHGDKSIMHKIKTNANSFKMVYNGFFFSITNSRLYSVLLSLSVLLFSFFFFSFFTLSAFYNRTYKWRVLFTLCKASSAHNFEAMYSAFINLWQ